MFTVQAATVVATLLLWVSTVLGGTGFTSSCYNYYLGNGVSDSTGDLFIEAWCHGGIFPNGTENDPKCTRLSLAECLKTVDGQLRGFEEHEEPYPDIFASCDIETCAMRGDAWDGPIMSCYCQNGKGDWKMAKVNLNEHVGNNAGKLECGRTKGSLSCYNPWAPKLEKELR